MKSIGFRAEKTVVRYVVLEGDEDPRKIVADGKFAVGENRPLSDELVLLRTSILNVLKTYRPDGAGMFLSGNPQRTGSIQSMFTRARLEGVVMEAVGTHGITLKAGPEATIKSGMKTKTSLKKYRSRDEVRGINLSVRGRKSDVYKDTVYAALSAIGA